MISDVYFPRINGVSTSTQTFCREFRQLGHSVTLIAPDYPDSPDPQTAGPGPDIIRIPSRYLFVDPEDRLMKGRAIRRLTERLRGEQYDLVHIQTPFVAHYLGLKLARRLGLPTVESYHTLFEEYLYNYVSWLPRRWLRFAARRFSARQCNAVDAVVVPSTAMHETLRRYGVGGRIEIIPTGMELGEFTGCDGQRFRARHGIHPQRPTLVHVGRVAHEKNIEFLLHVTARVKAHVPEVLLVIAGEGPAQRHLKRRADELGLQDNVLFVGYLSREDALLDCYCAGDAFVFASRTETQGLVLLEAMALGVPVVSTAVMGTRDILAPGRGALVAEEDVDDFSAKVCRVLTDRALRGRLGADARAYARTWSASAQAGTLVELYRDLALGHAADKAPARP